MPVKKIPTVFLGFLLMTTALNSVRLSSYFDREAGCKNENRNHLKAISGITEVDAVDFHIFLKKMFNQFPPKQHFLHIQYNPVDTNTVKKRKTQEENLYMKATGIVRRIDDLGRVVIPKEIRRTMRIREGDPLEIYTDRDGRSDF